MQTRSGRCQPHRGDSEAMKQQGEHPLKGGTPGEREERVKKPGDQECGLSSGLGACQPHRVTVASCVLEVDSLIQCCLHEQRQSTV